MTPDQAALAIEKAMTYEERALFLEEYYGLYPAAIGAKVADILDDLSNTDAHLDDVEPMLEEQNVGDPCLVATAIRACVWLYGHHRFGWPEVMQLLLRVSH